MNTIGIPFIVLTCYITGEIFKIIFKKKNKIYKLIPYVMAILGGLLGVLIYMTNNQDILNASNIWDAIAIGIISGLGTTGTNQLIKQIKNK